MNKLRYSNQVIFLLGFSNHMDVYFWENAIIYLISPNLILRVYVPACRAKSRWTVSYACLPRKCDYRTDARTQTDRRRTKWSLCAAMLRRRHKNEFHQFVYCWFIMTMGLCKHYVHNSPLSQTLWPKLVCAMLETDTIIFYLMGIS